MKTELKTQNSTLTFKPGKPIDFRALADAVDKAGFKAGAITIWAKGILTVTPDGSVTFTVSGSNQTFPVADSPELSAVKGQASREISIVAKVLFAETPPRLALVAEAGKGLEGMKGMKGM